MQPDSPARDIIFYDGTCGLCHGFVRWTMDRDLDGLFQFAPLQGETFRSSLTDERRAGLPDSVIVLTNEGQLLTRSDAAIYVAQKIRAASALAGVVKVLPRTLRDVAYDFIARIRYRIFGRKSDLCPMMPLHLRSRFLP